MKRKVNVESEGSVSKKVNVNGESNLKLIRPSEVPVYLHDSEFYKSLDMDDDDEFLLPSNLMKRNTDVVSLDDLSELLNTIRYWGVNVFPSTIVDFCLTQNLQNLKRVLCGLKHQFVVMQALLIVLNDYYQTTSRLEAAMEFGDIRLVKYVEQQSDATERIYTTRAFAFAAEKGNIECLEHALNQAHRWSRHGYWYKVYRSAVVNGKIACVELLYSSAAIRVAAEHGQLECLKFLHEKGSTVLTRDLCEAAAQGGHLDCLKYLKEQRCSWNSSKMCVFAASAGSIACLEYVHSYTPQSILSVEVGISAARADSLACLMYYLNHGGERSYEICYIAALCGHLACLQYAHTRGCPLTDSTARATYIVAETARYQHWDCVKYLIENNCHISRTLPAILFNAGQTDLLHLIEEHSHVA